MWQIDYFSWTYIELINRVKNKKKPEKNPVIFQFVFGLNLASTLRKESKR